MWTCEQWTNLANPCSAAVWDPKGETLLFALRDEPAIFCITFPKSGLVGELVTGQLCTRQCDCV